MLKLACEVLSMCNADVYYTDVCNADMYVCAVCNRSPIRQTCILLQVYVRAVFSLVCSWARQACFVAAKSKRCYKVAECLRNVWGTISFTCVLLCFY